MNPKYLPSLNGWRAVSISFVLLNHFVYYGSLLKYNPFEGNFGVRLFFGISGFIITYLLIQEEIATGKVNLKHFYVRRALKILPLYFLYVFICFILHVSNLQTQDWSAWRGLLTFTRNFHDQVNESGNDWLSGHLWSVSVEEQFYLVWPFVFLLRKFRIPFLIFCTSFSIAFRTVELFGVSQYSTHYLFQINNTFNYLDTLGWGCLAAFLLCRHQQLLLSLAKKTAFNTFAFVAGFCLVVFPYSLQFGQGLQAFGFMVLLIHSVLNPHWFLYKLLNLKAVERVGVCSYSIYIWQQLIVWLWPNWIWWGLWLPCAVAVGLLSYRYIEQPFLLLKKSFAPDVGGVDAPQKIQKASAVLS